MRGITLLLALSGPVAIDAVEQKQTMMVAANPIRKVVTMMQALQAKVQAEGEKEKELYDKYMCYCKNGAEALAKSIADAEAKGPELQAAIKEGTGKLTQLKEDVKQHKADRAAAKTAMAEATAIREKEAAEFAKATEDLKTNLAAMHKAVTAIEKGMGDFLQTGAAATLRTFAMNTQHLMDADRQDLLAFLSEDSAYAPASGEIVGILKQMGDEMAADLKDATDEENAKIATYDGLMAAKKKEVESLTKQIEEKLTRIGDLGVEIQEMKNDLGDTLDGLEDDKKFLADLDKNCELKQKLYEENVKYRTEELAALADTIKVLNDDDALELFKKTLPGASASFLQIQVSRNEMKTRALSLLQEVQQSDRRPALDFIALALRGKKIGFEKVITMIDDLVKELHEEQKADETKKEYCNEQFDESEDKHKVLTKTISDLETAIADSLEAIDTTKAEIDALSDGIRKLDKSVAEATEQRKEENQDYTELMAADGAAKELLNFAKNRLNKFYNPKLYKPPAKKELSEEDRATLAAGGTLAPTEAPGGIAGTGITAFAQEAPPPPPESFKAYSKKSEESNGIIAMIDMLIKDLDKEMTEAEVTEKDAQEDYEQYMKDSAEKRAQDSKSLTDKEAALADLETTLGDQKADKAQNEKDLGALNQYITSLHGECDWLIKYFDMRKEARDNEIDALGKAKAVLSGADYSLVQVGIARSRKFLRK
jgi:chromosome segregation ATPase